MQELFLLLLFGSCFAKPDRESSKNSDVRSNSDTVFGCVFWFGVALLIGVILLVGILIGKYF